MQDFLEQINVIQQLGSLKDILAKMPMFGLQLPEGANIDDGELVVNQGDDQLDDDGRTSSA